MMRDEMLARAEGMAEEWDFIIIGGGATGVGCAIDAASRGYRTLLLEQHDFAKGTSSRSTKLIHGGVRYLQQGNISLVLDALKERGILRQNAPHLVSNLPFIVPNYDWWEAPFYGIGLRIYDMLAGKLGFGPSKNLSKAETIKRIPTIETEGLRGGVIYYDGQFDDARLVVNMTQTAAEQGAIILNYVKVTELTKSKGLIDGVVAEDMLGERKLRFKCKAVINATGAFSDAVRRMDDAGAKPLIQPSQGVHIVLQRDFLPGESAIMVPNTDDGRVLFAIPWHNRVVVGTTDTPVTSVSLEPKPMEEELEFLLVHAARYLTKDPEPKDVLSAFAGLRPLVGSGDAEDTSSISRDHTINISRTGLVTIAGGKWTTYRKMAEDTIDQASVVAHLEPKPCVTKTLQIHGCHFHAAEFGELKGYGSDAPAIRSLIQSTPAYGEALHSRLDTRVGEVVWSVRREMAQTVEDILARRTRALLLDARASIEAAPKVAEVMAAEMGYDRDWQKEQVVEFEALARGYLLS